MIQRSGARPLRRYITNRIETPLAKEIIAGNVLPNTIVEIGLKDDQLVFETKQLTNFCKKLFQNSRIMIDLSRFVLYNYV